AAGAIDDGAGASTEQKKTIVHRVFQWRAQYQARRRVARNRVIQHLQRAEARCGDFLPLHLSSISRDECFREVAEVVREAEVTTALVVGAAPSGPNAAAVLTATLAAGAEARAFCIDTDSRRLRSLERSFGGRITCYHIASSTPSAALCSIGETIDTI